MEKLKDVPATLAVNLRFGYFNCPVYFLNLQDANTQIIHADAWLHTSWQKHRAT